MANESVLDKILERMENMTNDEIVEATNYRSKKLSEHVDMFDIVFKDRDIIELLDYCFDELEVHLDTYKYSGVIGLWVGFYNLKEFQDLAGWELFDEGVDATISTGGVYLNLLDVTDQVCEAEDVYSYLLYRTKEDEI